MAIYRGAGGPGDATTDAANQATVASNKATDASNSATAAANSATAAGISAYNAGLSATSASDSATDAGLSETNAGLSETAAGISATSASNSKQDAQKLAINAEDFQYTLSDGITTGYSALHYKNKAEDAKDAAVVAQGLSETAQGLSEIAQGLAEDARDLAQEWATKTTGTVTGTSEYSSKYYAQASQAASDAALSALDSFDDRYLGVKSSDPALDNDGNALVSGALYFNSVDGVMKVYDATQWLAAYADVSGALVAINNLSDLNNIASARTNLGLGTAATTAATDYATAAQGALADSALQSETDPVYIASSWYSTTNNASNWDTAYGWGNHASAGYLTSFTETDPIFVASPAYGITGTKISNWDDSYTWVSAFPTQTGQSGKFLTTDGSSLSFAAVDALPDQTSHSGEFLTTDGTNASWAAIETGNVTTAGIWEHSATISANYTISSGNNAMSAGPITVASGVTVTVPSGSTWVII